MSEISENPGYIDNNKLSGNERRLVNQVLNGKYGELIEGFDKEKLGDTEKKLVNDIPKNMKRINTTSFFQVLHDTEGALRDSGNFYELYVAKKVKNNIPQEIVGEDTEEVELDNGEKSSNYIKNRERQAVKDMFNLFSLDEKTAELEALLDFFKQIDTLSVNDDLNALHELIKYNVYVKKYISSEGSFDPYTTISDLNLSGSLRGEGILDEKDIADYLQRAELGLDMKYEGPERKVTILNNLLLCVGVEKNEGESFKEVLQRNPAVLQRIHKWFKVIPGENVHGLLMYGKENRSKEKKDKEQLLITQMTKFLGDNFDGVLAKLKNAEGLDQSYDGAKTKFLEQMQELTPEYKRQWFAGLIGILLQKLNGDTDLTGGGGILAIQNLFKKDPQSLLGRLNFSLTPTYQSLGDGKGLPSVQLGVSIGGGSKQDNRVEHFWSVGAGIGLTKVESGIVQDESLSASYGVSIDMNRKAGDGWGSDAAYTSNVVVTAGATGVESAGTVSAGKQPLVGVNASFSLEKSEMDGHERELTKVKDNMYEIVNYLKASTETDIDAKIKDATDAILATPGIKKRAGKMRDKVENLVQDIAGIVQDFQISRDPSLTQVELVEMLADGMILTLDEAGLLDMKSGFLRSIYLSKIGVSYRIDLTKPWKTLGKTAPWDVATVGIKYRKDIEYLAQSNASRNSVLTNLIAHGNNTEVTNIRDGELVDPTSKPSIDRDNALLGVDAFVQVVLAGGVTYRAIQAGIVDTGTLGLISNIHGEDMLRYCQRYTFDDKAILILPRSMPVTAQVGTAGVDQFGDNTDHRVIILGDRGTGEVNENLDVIDLANTDIFKKNEFSSLDDTDLNDWDEKLFSELAQTKQLSKAKISIQAAFSALHNEREDQLLEGVNIVDGEDGLLITANIFDTTKTKIIGSGYPNNDNSDKISMPLGSTIRVRYIEDTGESIVIIEHPSEDAKPSLLTPVSTGFESVKTATKIESLNTPINLESLPEAYKKKWSSNEFRDLFMTFRYAGDYPGSSSPSSTNQYKKYLKLLKDNKFDEGETLLRENIQGLGYSFATKCDEVFGEGEFDKRMSNGKKNAILKQIEGDLSLTYMTEYKHLDKTEALKVALGDNPDTVEGLLGDADLNSELKSELQRIIFQIYNVFGLQGLRSVGVFNEKKDRLEEILKKGLGDRFNRGMEPKEFYGYVEAGDRNAPLAKLAILLMPASLIMQSRATMYKNGLKNTLDHEGNKYSDTIINSEESIWSRVEAQADENDALAAKGNGTGEVEQGVVGVVATYPGNTVMRKQVPNPRMEKGTFVEVKSLHNLEFLQRQYLNDVLDTGTEEKPGTVENYIQSLNEKYTEQGMNTDDLPKNKQSLIDFFLEPENGKFTLLYGMYGPCKNRMKSHTFEVHLEKNTKIDRDLIDVLPLVVESETPISPVFFGHTKFKYDPSMEEKEITFNVVRYREEEQEADESTSNPDNEQGSTSEAVIDAIQEGGITFDAEGLSPLGDYSIGGTTFNGRFAILSSGETVFLNVGGTVIISGQQNNVIAGQGHTFRYLDAETIRVQGDSQTYREYIDSKNMSYVPKKEKKPRRDRRLKEPKENDE